MNNMVHVNMVTSAHMPMETTTLEQTEMEVTKVMECNNRNNQFQCQNHKVCQAWEVADLI